MDLPPDAASRLTDLYARFRDLTSRANAKRHEQRELGELVKKAKDAVQRQSAIRTATEIKPEVQHLTAEVARLEDELRSLALLLPNTTHPSSPHGAEKNAVTVSVHGPERLPVNPARHHVTVGNALDLLDLPAGATVSGFAWYFLKNEAAQLELALINYALSIAVKRGYTPTTTPDVVRSDIARRAGFRPRDAGTPVEASQIYSVETPRGAPELVLAGTAEIPLAGMHARQTYEPGALPRKLAGLGRAFRAEAGAGGADTRGLYRVHQFAKLELFVVCGAEESEAILEEIRAVQVEIFEGLGFPFRWVYSSLGMESRADGTCVVCLICRRKNSAPLRIASMISRPGCLGAVNGARSRARATARTTRPVGCSSGIPQPHSEGAQPSHIR